MEELIADRGAMVVKVYGEVIHLDPLAYISFSIIHKQAYIASLLHTTYTVGTKVDSLNDMRELHPPC